MVRIKELKSQIVKLGVTIDLNAVAPDVKLIESQQSALNDLINSLEEVYARYDKKVVAALICSSTAAALSFFLLLFASDIAPAGLLIAALVLMVVSLVVMPVSLAVGDAIFRETETAKALAKKRLASLQAVSPADLADIVHGCRRDEMSAAYQHQVVDLGRQFINAELWSIQRRVRSVTEEAERAKRAREAEMHAEVLRGKITAGGRDLPS